MKPNFKKFTVFFISILVIVLIAFLVVKWVINGGIPNPGPTGETVPIHIISVFPKDGDSVKEDPSGRKLKGYCVEFGLRAGNGIYKNERMISYFFDGFDVTNKTSGMVTQDYPPSLGSYCYNSSDILSPGWHTAKVAYKDNLNNAFQYTWRFQVQK